MIKSVNNNRSAWCNASGVLGEDDDSVLFESEKRNPKVEAHIRGGGRSLFLPAPTLLYDGWCGAVRCRLFQQIQHRQARTLYVHSIMSSLVQPAAQDNKAWTSSTNTQRAAERLRPLAG